LIIVTVLTSERRRADGFSSAPTIGAIAVHALLDMDACVRVRGGPLGPMVVGNGLRRHVSEAGTAGITTIAIAGPGLARHTLAAGEVSRSSTTSIAHAIRRPWAATA